MSRVWWAPLTGVAFVVVVILSFIIGGEPPSAEDGAQKVVDFYKDDKDSIQIGAALVIPAGALLIFFASLLAKSLAAARAAGSSLPAALIAGATIIAVAAGIDNTILFANSEAVDDNIDPTAVLALQALWDNDFLPFAVGIVVFDLAAGLAILRYGDLPKWLGWIALLLGVVGMTPIGFAAFIGTALWIIVTSIMLTLANRSASAGAVAPPAPGV